MPGTDVPCQWDMVKNAARGNTEPFYATIGGETFYIGNEGKSAEKKHRQSIFSRIFRRRSNSLQYREELPAVGD